MSRFFSPDNKFFTGMSKIFDMLVLSLLWLILCLPIITIGPASTAFYYTVVKVIRRERSYLLKEFFRSFRLNFKQGAILTLIYVMFIVVAYVDFRYAITLIEEGKQSGSMMLGIFIVLTVFVIFSVIYVFPVLSRFTVTIKNLFKWAFFLSIRHIGWTLLIGVMFVGFGIIMFFSFFWMPPLVIILPGVYTLVASFPMEKVLKKYMPQEETTEEDGIDRWYNE
jgi:uncharacterized membrane protein YesL